MPYKQSHPNAQDRELVFHLTDSVAGTPKLGQVFAGADIQVRKPAAGAYVNAANPGTVVEIGGGDYVLTLAQAEIDTPGPGFAVKVNKAGCVSWSMSDEIQRAYIGKIVAGTLGVSAFTTDRAEATVDYWKDCLITFLTGNLVGQVKKIGGSAGGASQLITLAAGLAFAGAPAANDIYEILTR